MNSSHLAVVSIGIDLRSVSPVIRDQGSRSTCLACSTSDAHAIFHGCEALSAEFLFYHAIQIATVGNLTDGITFDEASRALKQHGQPAEQDWPYSQQQPMPWTPPAVSELWRAVFEHGSANATTQITQLIKSGQPAVLGVKLSTDFLIPSGPHFVIPSHGAGFGGHAVLVVGLGQDVSGQFYFLIRNSWGASWGDSGHAWLATAYLTDKLIGFGSISP